MKMLLANPIAEPWLQKYHMLSERDKRALLVLAIFLVAVILWRGIWLPLDNAIIRTREVYMSARSDYTWMKAHAPQPQSETDNTSLVSTVNSSASLLQLSIAHAEPMQDNTVQVTIAPAPFDLIISWLERLQREHRIKASRIMLEKSANSPGYVSAQLTLAHF